MKIFSKLHTAFIIIAVLFCFDLFAQNNSNENNQISSSTLNNFKFRAIGPAYTSGRISDIEVNPKNSSIFYVGVACGHVWKTENAGVTFSPIFDNYGSYSIADIEIDPNNTNVVWVATGEYNSQRAIGYGDGIYLSVNGGKSFTNVGLNKTEHIGRIAIDPRNSRIYVAAQGPLWGSGGQRGIFKSDDKGKTWDTLFTISKYTGFNDIIMDPRNPDILYASSYQRERKVYTLIDGGPESAIYKSEDAGKSWRKLTSGLPSGSVGRIGIDISQANPDYIYAIIEGSGSSGGFYRSTDRGESWSKMNSYVSESPQYYNRIYCDPIDSDKVYSMDTYSQYTNDGGKTWNKLGRADRHEDDHAIWIDPINTNHLIIGGDGGLYESFDMSANWRHTSNLPITQFYRIAVDNSKPFYNVAGGTQDNNSMVGPSQTICKDGIFSEDWTFMHGGDGFFCGFDPENPDIIYAESQYGGLVRFDKRSGERVYIQPMPLDEETYRWNWNAPFAVSKHHSDRLYFAANKMFRSDDKGHSWKVISPDLTRQIDRNTLKVMDMFQPVDAVGKHSSTSFFGNIVAFDESSINENLIIVGTDDGLIQITTDGGMKWEEINRIKEVPEMTYVSAVLTSQHDENILYTSFDARKNNDLSPFMFKSLDKGKTWFDISGNLPDIGTVYCIAEDYLEPQLLFIGTEFGVWYSINGGGNWVKLNSGIPVIAVHDIKIQKDEDDLVVGTFGRGIYILDDYALLRTITSKTLKEDYIMFPVKDANIFSQTSEKYGQGASMFAGTNPEYGVTFTYYIKDKIKTKKDYRLEAEKTEKEKNIEISYPTMDILTEEADELEPYIMFTISNEKGEVVRRIKRPASNGVQRFNWGLRRFNMYPVTDANSTMHNSQSGGIPVPPGKYYVSMSKVINGFETLIGEKQSFTLTQLDILTLPAQDPAGVELIKKEAAQVYGVTVGMTKYIESMLENVKALKIAFINGGGTTDEDMVRVDEYISELREMNRALSGNEVIEAVNEDQPLNLNYRISAVIYGAYHGSDITQTMKDNLRVVRDEVDSMIKRVKNLEQKFLLLEKRANTLGCPWSPGRIPEFD